MSHKAQFKKKLLPAFIAACTAASFSPAIFAQDDDIKFDEEVVVVGVRGAQERSINIKKNSSQMVDAISAEDIGKLPDSTIADSLQRVTGIQIQRSAGQGGVVSVRGQQEVMTTLNGEVFLTAENILDSKVSFQDVPSSLITGSNVYKSMNASQLEGGIGGSIDLLTRRSLSLDEGFSGSVRVQGAYGSITEEVDPELSGLLGVNFDGKAAMSLSFSFANQNLSDHSVKTLAAQRQAFEPHAGKDLDGDGETTTRALTMWDWNGPELYKNDTKRERIGLAYNFNADLGNGFELNLDTFYNSMNEEAAGNLMHLGEGLDWTQSNFVRLYGVTPIEWDSELYDPNDADGVNAYSTGWEMLSSGNLRAGTNSDYRDTKAFNNSLELKYDNGGAFTGSVRYVSSKAYKDESKLKLRQKASSSELVVDADGKEEHTNPGAISGRYSTTFRAFEDEAYVNFNENFVNAMNSKDAWYFHSSWLEGERHDVNLDVLRADGKFEFEDSVLTSVNFGVRFSEREARKDTFHYFMPVGVEAFYEDDPDTKYEMMVKFHEPGYIPGKADEVVGTIYNSFVDTDRRIDWEPVESIELSDTHVAPYLSDVTDLGAAVSGFNAVIPMVDATKIGDHVGFMNTLYDTNHVRRQRPDQSYIVSEARDSFYVSADFDSQLSDNVVVTGNFGVRRVTDIVTVTRNKTDKEILAKDIYAGADQNHTHYLDLGDDITVVKHSHFLPSFNSNFLFGDKWKLKLSYDKRTSLQSLNDFGEGSSTDYSSNQTDPDSGVVYQAISKIKKGGNPHLNPWSADVYNIAGEWYPSDNTIVGLTAFYMDIGGFVDTFTETDPDVPDSDGVVREGATIESKINGKNASVRGLEFSYQQSFDFLPGLLANTGVNFNYTYSPSTKDGKKFATDGNEVPFNSTAKNQSNLVLWYNNDKFEFRLAANYLGKKYDGQHNFWRLRGVDSGDEEKGITGGLDKWEDSTLYVDLNSTYHVNDNINVSFNVQNLTEEQNVKYYHWKDYRSEYYAFERRLNLGVNVKF